MKVYIAAPFFNPTQLAIVEAIKQKLTNIDYPYCYFYSVSIFSPKDESMFKQGDNPETILNLNCNAILTSDFVIAVTDDKDVGTMFECGYAYANGIPILYIWLGKREGQKFNLMLAASGRVIHKISELDEAIAYYSTFGTFKVIEFDGLIE
jgi:nucleoside 2-deoxyribosyltransferase